MHEFVHTLKNCTYKLFNLMQPRNFKSMLCVDVLKVNQVVALDGYKRASHVYADFKITYSVILLTDFYTLRKDVETVLERVEEIRASAGLKLLEKNLADLEEASGDSSLWDDRVKAQQTLQALTDVKEKIKLLNDFKAQVFVSIN